MLFIFVLLNAGCTSLQLRHSTVKQMRSLPDLQRQVVLDNLASFVCDPNSIPFQANLRDGATQISDLGTADGDLFADFAMHLGISRGIVDQWSMVPVSDDTTLKLLQLAYRRALGVESCDLFTIEPESDFANSLAHELKKQTAQVDDARTIRAQLEAIPVAFEGPIQPEDEPKMSDLTSQFGLSPKANQAKLAKYITATNSVISSNSDRIILKGEVLNSETEKYLAYVPVRPNGDWAFGLTADGHFVPDENSNFMLSTPLAIELRRQVKEINEDISKIQPGWVGVACRKSDIPDCVRFVGRSKVRGRDRFVYVLPAHEKQFEEFTLEILSLSGLLKESQVLAIPGVRYSPTTSSRH